MREILLSRNKKISPNEFVLGIHLSYLISFIYISYQTNACVFRETKKRQPTDRRTNGRIQGHAVSLFSQFNGKQKVWARHPMKPTATTTNKIKKTRGDGPNLIDTLHLYNFLFPFCTDEILGRCLELNYVVKVLAN